MSISDYLQLHEKLPVLRLFLDGERDPTENMAVDEALYLNELYPVLRFYQWSTPAVSLGYFCSQADAQTRHGSDFAYVRRWTGGGTVEHGGADATYCLTLPKSCFWSQLRTEEIYRLVHGALAVALAESGIATDSFDEREPARGGACFQNPVTRDLAVSGRKVAGAAIRRTTTGVLLQGSIQNVDVPEDLPMALAQCLATSVEIWDPGESLNDHIASLVENRYGRSEWISKR